MNKGKVSIILPALNEAETIGKVIDEIPKQALEQAGYSIEVLVVDNSSTDQTAQIAQEKGARVITEPRRGKGRAVRTAFEQVRADFVFMLDADYTYPATYIPDMLKLLNQGYSVVIGSRLKGQREKGAISRLNIIGNHLLTLMANTLYRTRISDLCTGYWGFKGEVIPKLNLSAEGFNLEAELFSQVAKKGYRIGEVPINYLFHFSSHLSQYCNIRGYLQLSSCSPASCCASSFQSHSFTSPTSLPISLIISLPVYHCIREIDLVGHFFNSWLNFSMEI